MKPLAGVGVALFVLAVISPALAQPFADRPTNHWAYNAIAELAAKGAGYPDGTATRERLVIVPAESQVVYRVGEVFFSRNNQVNVAVGTTNAVRGEVWIDRSDPRRSHIGPITVDVSTFMSDQERRDSAIRAWWLESSRFPMAQFTPTAIHGLPDVYVPGRTEYVQIAGNLRIRQVTRPATFDATLKFDDGVLSGVATTTMMMTDYGFAPPSILGILKAENQVQVGFRFIARAAR